MRIFCLDTSSKYLSLAVAEDKKILSQTHRSLDRKHSTQLIPLIDQTLKRARLALGNIDGFCVSKGPGSFTGLRIGITTIKGLAFVLGKPVVAIPSLDILIQNLKPLKNKRLFKGTKKQMVSVDKEKKLQVCPIIDAKQNKVYTCLYLFKNGTFHRKWRYLLLTVPELLKKISGEITFLGDGIGLYREAICKSKKIKPIFTKEKTWYPQAKEAAALALERFHKGRLDDVNSLAPLYLYPKECQIKK